ncbi:hypothetical protein [Erythrobacter sp. THAF29]|uniref:hypothetical protein n=1 Tax=Erythrobacter sp. THAF29 TaxID=2587851 RepID=UPI0012685974|nr:hypothetical protein [Erythrobacter sp. THAF29]
MTDSFLSREIIFRFENDMQRGEISISQPAPKKNGRYECFVSFEPLRKYDAVIGGIDQIHSIECAIAYIEAVCKNSKEPEFFWINGDAMFREREE